jgi:hypothetical protein
MAEKLEVLATVGLIAAGGLIPASAKRGADVSLPGPLAGSPLAKPSVQ